MKTQHICRDPIATMSVMTLVLCGCNPSIIVTNDNEQVIARTNVPFASLRDMNSVLRTTRECVRTSADQGNADAQFNLGVMYHYGEGVEKNEVEAVKWFKRAAEQGNHGAKQVLEPLQK